MLSPRGVEDSREFVLTRLAVRARFSEKRLRVIDSESELGVRSAGAPQIAQEVGF